MKTTTTPAKLTEDAQRHADWTLVRTHEASLPASLRARLADQPHIHPRSGALHRQAEMIRAHLAR